MKKADAVVLTEDLAGMPLHEAFQACASRLIAGGAEPGAVFEAAMAVALAGKIGLEAPMEVAKKIHLLAAGLMGQAALEEIDNSAVRH